ncbi:MAG: mobile mystery protein B [Gemmatimonadales bacterium]
MRAAGDALFNAEGSTPLDEDEIEGLIPPHVRTRAELNVWEATNISDAVAWAYGRAHVGILSVKTLRELHRRMFGATWAWAGTYRRSDKGISPHHWSQVPALMHELVNDTHAQREASDRTVGATDGIATRFHHRLVHIHPWPNGNGRHARLATDLLLREWNRPAFTWGSAGSAESADFVRRQYLQALELADGGNFDALHQFVRG